MKCLLQIAAVCLAIIGFCGCSDRKAELQKAQEESQTKARADAARKEMETLPTTFKSRDIFKKNEPEKQPSTTPPPDPAAKK
jgi:hypothetical protein